jgi:hypothetical protein
VTGAEANGPGERAIRPDDDPGAYFDVHDRAGAGGPQSAAWLARVVEQVNRRFFAVVRGFLGPGAEDTLAVQSEARDFMRAPTHSYPWSVHGARVLIRALRPSDSELYPQLFAAAERARDLFCAVGRACLTRAERARLSQGHIAGAAHCAIQTNETWRVHHALHNDSRRVRAQIPLIATFVLVQGPSAGRLRLWPSGEPAPRPLETMAGDLCLQRDCIELGQGKILYPLTHGTEAAAEPEGAERIVAILRFGILAESALQAIAACGADPMDLYLKALTRPDGA